MNAKTKVSKLLKEKNRLAGDVAKLKERLAKQNVRSEGQEFDYNNQLVLAELREAVAKLVAVKTALAIANSEIYREIFQLAEVKGLLSAIRELDTKSGLYREGRAFASEEIKVIYRAQIGKMEADRLAAELEAEIISLQDRLDEFNATKTVEGDLV